VINLLDKVPGKVNVAVSGGIDSMAALDFMRRGRRSVHAVHFDHGTKHGVVARKFVEEFCHSNQIPLTVETLSRDRKKCESPEEFWRNERIRFFRSFSSTPVVTAHHLDDAVEWWIFTCLNGKPKLMPCRNADNNVVRPFLSTPKSELISWCSRKGIPHVSDPSNNLKKFNRNRIRHDIVPHALIVNPGLRKVVKKKILAANAGGGRHV